MATSVDGRRAREAVPRRKRREPATRSSSIQRHSSTACASADVRRGRVRRAPSLGPRQGAVEPRCQSAVCRPPGRLWRLHRARLERHDLPSCFVPNGERGLLRAPSEIFVRLPRALCPREAGGAEDRLGGKRSGARAGGSVGEGGRSTEVEGRDGGGRASGSGPGTARAERRRRGGRGGRQAATGTRPRRQHRSSPFPLPTLLLLFALFAAKDASTPHLLSSALDSGDRACTRAPRALHPVCGLCGARTLLPDTAGLERRGARTRASCACEHDGRKVRGWKRAPSGVWDRCALFRKPHLGARARSGWADGREARAARTQADGCLHQGIRHRLCNLVL